MKHYVVVSTKIIKIFSGVKIGPVLGVIDFLLCTVHIVKTKKLFPEKEKYRA
jgi:hypothetical protein